MDSGTHFLQVLILRSIEGDYKETSHSAAVIPTKAKDQAEA